MQMQIRVETTKIIPDCDNREVKMQLCGSRLGRVPCQSKLQRKNAGTSSWPSWISHFTGSFVGHSPSEMLCPPALFRKGEDGRKKKREVLHLFRCYTHTPQGLADVCPNTSFTLEFLQNLQNLELMDWASPAHDECGGVGHKFSKAFLSLCHRQQTEAPHRLHIHTHGCSMCNGMVISHM